jgi:hypothetical protein
MNQNNNSNDKKKTIQKKSYSVQLPVALINRLSFLKKLRKGSIDIGKEITRRIYPFVIEEEKKARINRDTWKEAKKCPSCDSYLLLKTGKNGQFYGCFKYPACNHNESLK